jgi:hypothetical protein
MVGGQQEKTPMEHHCNEVQQSLDTDVDKAASGGGAGAENSDSGHPRRVGTAGKLNAAAQGTSYDCQ